MSKNIYWGKPSLELNGKPIEMNEATSLTLDDTQLTEYDIEPSEYSAKHYSLTFELSNQGDNPFATWYRRQCEIGRQQKKALLYAVTHGYKVVIPFRDDDDTEKYIVPLTPKMINSIFRSISWIPQLLILDKMYCAYNIKRGRLVRKKNVWPYLQELINNFEDSYGKENITRHYGARQIHLSVEIRWLPVPRNDRRRGKASL